MHPAGSFPRRLLLAAFHLQPQRAAGKTCGIEIALRADALEQVPVDVRKGIGIGAAQIEDAEEAGLGRIVIEELGLGERATEPDLVEWRALTERIRGALGGRMDTTSRVAAVPRERLAARRKAHDDGEWVRIAAAAYAAKQQRSASEAA